MVLTMALIVDAYNDTHYRKKLIENGCGQYDPITAEFEYINNLKENTK